jgi:hypothetical protein
LCRFNLKLSQGFKKQNKTNKNIYPLREEFVISGELVTTPSKDELRTEISDQVTESGLYKLRAWANPA